MELYHIHLLNNHDKMFQEGAILNINPEVFNNRLYNRIYNSSTNVDKKRYEDITIAMNNLFRLHGFKGYNNFPMGEILSYAYRNIDSLDKATIYRLLKDASDLLLKERFNDREKALEEYRYKEHPELPSRLHSLFACREDGIEHWTSNIFDGTVDIYSIEVEEEPFLSSDLLLPDDELNYGEKIKAAQRYFEPKEKFLHTPADEYLVQGRVRLRKLVDRVVR